MHRTDSAKDANLRLSLSCLRKRRGATLHDLKSNIQVSVRSPSPILFGFPLHRRRLLDFFGAREATPLPTAKSSSFAPAFNCSRSQTGCAPLPAQVLPDLSRYLTAILRPFREFCWSVYLVSPPSFESFFF